MPTTIDVNKTLETLGHREIAIACDLLKAYGHAGDCGNHSLPESWYDEGVCLDFNPYSGYVFLTNSDYQALIIDPEGGGVVMHYNTPYYGYEGTLEVLAERFLEDCVDGETITLVSAEWDAEDLDMLLDAIKQDRHALTRNSKSDGCCELFDLCEERLAQALEMRKAEETDN